MCYYELIYNNYPEVNLTVNGIIDNVKISSGQRLTTIAQKYYGNKHYWVYLYFYNVDVIDNPNNVKIGLEIEIPNLNKTVIDPNNRELEDIAIKIKKDLLKL